MAREARLLRIQTVFHILFLLFILFWAESEQVAAPWIDKKDETSLQEMNNRRQNRAKTKNRESASSFCHFNLFASFPKLTIHFGCNDTTVCFSLTSTIEIFLWSSQNIGSTSRIEREMFVLFFPLYFQSAVTSTFFVCFFFALPVKCLLMRECKNGDPREALVIAIAVNVYDVYSVGVIQVENDYWIFF